jgi:4-amino-4-deoxy-L-arabinose transferase-like glycosyltransferase
MTGKPFEFGTGDSSWYHGIASELANRGFGEYNNIFTKVGISDRGYPTYLGIVYMIFGNGLIIPRLIKALLGSISAVLIFKLTTRNFGENVGRMAALFIMLMPNLILYCGMHLKETEMVFLTVAFMERADYVIRSKKYNVINIFLPFLLAGLLFTFRTILGATAFFAIVTTLLFSSTEVIRWKRRLIIIAWALIAVSFFVGSNISTEVEQTWLERETSQAQSMNFRSTRENGNVFSQLIGKSVFVPLIFVIPFPTIVGVIDQDNQEIINGGNFAKNILVFFLFLGMIIIIRNGVWRDHLLIGSFILGYLLVLAMSSFAQSERFHQPVLPFILVLAAYGLSQVTNKNKKYYIFFLVFLFIAIIGWSWFKLAGRGLA